MSSPRFWGAMITAIVAVSANGAEPTPGFVNWIILMRQHPATAGWESRLYSNFQPRSAPIERKKLLASDLRATLEDEGPSYTPESRARAEADLKRLEAEIAADQKAVVADFEVAFNDKVKEFYLGHVVEVQRQALSVGYLLVVPDNVLNTDVNGVPREARFVGATDITSQIAQLARQASAQPAQQAQTRKASTQAPSGKSPEIVAREERESQERELEKARHHEQECANALEYVKSACSATTGKASLNAAGCVIQQGLYNSMKCDAGDLADATAEAQRKVAAARARERESAATAQANLAQIRNANACASAENLCRQNAAMCADARRLVIDSGSNCPNFDAVASQASADLQMQQEEAARAESQRRAEQQRLEEQHAAEQRRLAEAQRQRAEQVAAANQAARARTGSQQRQNTPSAASSGSFMWTHFERYFQTQGADRMNYAVHIQNTGTAPIRCGGNVQAQPAGYGVPRVSPYNIPVPPGQTREIAVLQNIVNGTGSYDVNCRVSD